jgi:DNA-binding LacI/PurR family transcriptional regulator
MIGGYVTRQRMLGWFDALGPAGVVPTVVQVRRTDAEQGEEGGRVLLDRPVDERPTAILAFSDAIAYGVTQAAQQRGLRIPDDLSVVGFDDNPLAQRMRPPLTTVRQDIDAKGRAAASALTAAIAASSSGATVTTRQQLIPTELVVRESTAPPPA